MWQYSSSGKVGGISGNVDMDLFDGSLDKLKGYTFEPTVTGPSISSTTSADDVRPEGGSKGIGDAAETEGFIDGNGLQKLKVNETDHCLAADMAGGDPFFLTPELDVKSGALGRVKMKVRAYDGPKEGRLHFVTKADGQWNEAEVIAFEVPGELEAAQRARDDGQARGPAEGFWSTARPH